MAPFVSVAATLEKSIRFICGRTRLVLDTLSRCMRLHHAWRCGQLGIRGTNRSVLSAVRAVLVGGPDAASYPTQRGSVRAVLSLAAQLLLPINGLCSKLKLIPISLVSRAGNACEEALAEPTQCAVLQPGEPSRVVPDSQKTRPGSINACRSVAELSRTSVRPSPNRVMGNWGR